MLHASLACTRADDASPDPGRPGVLRTRTLLEDDTIHRFLDVREVPLHDCAASGSEPLGLDRQGFATVDLSGHAPLQATLSRIRAAGTMSTADARELRRRLFFRTFPLSDGRRMRVLFVAGEGIIHRTTGPNGRVVDPRAPVTTTSGHGASVFVHGDQDVFGTPLRQLLLGAAPWLFHHRSPDGENRRAPLHLLNLWIPLQQITRPLVLMDQRTVDRRRHQLRYALPTEGILDRGDAMRVNDIWSFLHDERQVWHFTSEMDARSGYVFETTSTPHGACSLPGEVEAEARWLLLRDAIDAIARADVAALARIAEASRSLRAPADTTAPLRRAIAAMDALLAELRDAGERFVDDAGPRFRERATDAMDRVVRRSVELRLVARVSGRERSTGSAPRP